MNFGKADSNLWLNASRPHCHCNGAINFQNHHQCVSRRTPHCEMNHNFASKLLLFACLAGWTGTREDARLLLVDQAKPLVVFTTAPKQIAANLKLSNGSTSSMLGVATLTVVKANEDDSLTGILVYRLPDDVRQKIAQSSSRKLAEVPISITQSNLTANFRRGAACPLIRLQVLANDAVVGDATVHFDSVTLSIAETPNQINQLFCSWTRQINAKRQRLGIIAAINRLIMVEEEDVENKPVKP